ncbi:MmgE/PrpD family protein [Rhodoplanes sp. Z2-YC6860]|uniref:MmgE/PrpD family protein n=1 Tax=Rhodoplanes sp. Z2-YC6860 TaxID=674703 RepID=UPI00078B6FA5|nr:MmgE/PrpD family protein [Rhodoplanes sp. Z2-YC6860]AMN44376.1 MmgE/PrpD family protein [Rhodoplanes sp. Z2-YC6860]
MSSTERISDKGASATGSTALLAEFCASLRFDQLPTEVVAKAKASIVDTLGCCVFGASLASVGKVAAMAAAENAAPVATVFSLPLRTSAALAALVNGTSAHAFQFDEIHIESTLHPGSLALPAAFALAEAGHAVSGRDLIVAMAAASEIGIRIGLAARGGMFKSGFHNQGTTGVFVAAAAAARILRLDAGQTTHAFGIAGSQAAGLMAVQNGAMTKSFHCGRAAQGGVYAAQLAQLGYTGIADVLDGSYGTFFSAFLDDWSAPAMCEGLSSHWHMLRTGFKPAPAANGSITGMTAIDTIMREQGLSAADIERITAYVSDNTLHHCGWPYEPDRVQSVLTAQMSLRYGLAVMALDRTAGPAQFNEARLRDPNIMAIIDRIAIEHEPRFEGENGRYRVACRLVVECKGGARHETSVLYRKGSPEDPMSTDELSQKYERLMARSGRGRSRQIAQYISQLDHVGDLGELWRLLKFDDGASA